MLPMCPVRFVTYVSGRARDFQGFRPVSSLATRKARIPRASERAPLTDRTGDAGTADISAAPRPLFSAGNFGGSLSVETTMSRRTGTLQAVDDARIGGWSYSRFP